MKLTLLMLATITLTNAFPAQQTPPQQDKGAENPPGVVVHKFSWNSHVNWPNWDRDTYRNPIDAADQERVQIAKAVNQQRQGASVTMPQWDRRRALTGTSGFQYKLTIENASTKTIKVVSWDYIFSDANGQEIERHHFRSRVLGTIKPGKTKEVIRFSLSQPVKVIDASTLASGKANHEFKERVVINRIDYADGSSWQRPQN